MPSEALDLPRPFGPFTLLKRLAVGGMAEVYVAKTRGLGGFEKLLAIKVIHPDFSEDGQFVEMLIEEAKISVRLAHVNIGQTFDLGRVDGTYYIAMELVEGVDAFRLSQRAKLRGVALPVDSVVHILAEVARGLAHAHGQRDEEGRPLGIVHRDVSPQNVLLSYAGEVKLVDFGIAKAALRSGQTEVGVIKGKYHYMAPEQAWGDPVDGRTDVFSAGLVLYELLTGTMVYTGGQLPELLDRVRQADVPDPRRHRRSIPDDLVAILRRATALEPDDRYATAEAFAHALSGYLTRHHPMFTPSRLTRLMATLYQDEVDRESLVMDLPLRDADPSDGFLAAMSRDEYALPPGSSMLSLPLPTPTPRPVGRDADQATAELASFSLEEAGQSAAQEWDPRDAWQERTVIDTRERTMTVESAELSTVDDEGDERPVLVVSDAPRRSVPPPPGLSLSQVATEARVEVGRTVALAEVPAGGRRAGPMSQPSSAGVPLGASAERLFEPPSAAVATAASGERRDPFVARPWPSTPDLGLPRPARTLGAALVVGALVAGLAYGGSLLYAQATAVAPSLEVITVPTGAHVRVNGLPRAERTPLVVETVGAEGDVVSLAVSLDGHRPTELAVELHAGLNRRLVLLDPIRVSLVVHSEPPGAQVYVDGVLHGDAPLEVAGLRPGQRLSLRAVMPGRAPVERTHVVTDEMGAVLQLVLPPTDAE